MTASKAIHDMRNPLNSITMNAELGNLIVQGGSIDPERLKKIFTIILRECKDCSDRLEDLTLYLDQQSE